MNIFPIEFKTVNLELNLKNDQKYYRLNGNQTENFENSKIKNYLINNSNVT